MMESHDVPSRRRLPAPLPGFEHINRYWDKYMQMPAAKILPGEFYVSSQTELITTVLGSCVAACIRDTKLGIGGMNHFMLPKSRSPDGSWGGDFATQSRYGNWAMEYLINAILKMGGSRTNLEVKIFGGANVIQSSAVVGTKNIDFVLRYLEDENMAVAAQDLGGVYPRKVMYFPDTGAAKVRRLKDLSNSTIVDRESTYRKRIDGTEEEGGSVELFE